MQLSYDLVCQYVSNLLLLMMGLRVVVVVPGEVTPASEMVGRVSLGEDT